MTIDAISSRLRPPHRQPLRGLDRYDGAPVAHLRTATRGALERLVDKALAERVDFVLLAGKGYDYWALGHVHAREVVAESPRIVFPGNLQGRNADETGPKGCELVTVEAGRIEAEFVPLDVVRWSQVSVSLDGVDRLEVISERIRSAIVPLLAGAADRLHAMRVTLGGATQLHRVEAR